jgi:hypothetical protein
MYLTWSGVIDGLFVLETGRLQSNHGIFFSGAGLCLVRTPLHLQLANSGYG